MKTSLILTTSITLLATVGLAQGNGNGSSNGNQPPSNFWATEGNANTDSTNFIGSTDDQDVIIKTNNEERMRILSNGNIGIGSDDPIQKLHVEGDAVINNGKFKLTGVNGFGGPQIIFGGTPSENGDWSIEYREFATVKGLNFWKPWPSANSGNAKFFIADNGKVGIATGNPLAKLDVNGNIRIADGTQGANKVLVSNANGIAQWKNLSDITTASNGVYTSLNATDYLKVGTGSLYLSAPLSTLPNGIITSPTAHEVFTSGQDLWIQSNAYNGSANTIINGTAGGNVGIGKFNPTAKLDVRIETDYPTTKESGIRITYPIPSLPQSPAPPTINNSIFEIRQSVPFGGTFAPRFIVKANGRVGIGVNDPLAQLHVHNGYIRVTGSNSYGGPQLVFGGTTNGDGDWGIESISGSVGGLNFWKPGIANGNYKMFIGNNGRVSIGLDPSAMFMNHDVNDSELPYKLFVKEGILTERVKVALETTNDWADYVFEESYELKSIEEVEAYIEAEGHLPGVPSAEEVKETGIDVAKMDAKLLEKIEELMLYNIQLKKELEALKSDMEELKKQ